MTEIIEIDTGPGKRQPELTKEGIFHYVYAVLHDPNYREKYALNLKRELPRVPLHGTLRADFWRWAKLGSDLMDLHIGYESAAPFAFTRIEVPDTKGREARGKSFIAKCLLKSDSAAGSIAVDSETSLCGIPTEAWRFRLGSRSAIDWVLEQYKERTPKDPTIRTKFDTYRLANHKERVIDLLARVVTVSLATLHIVAEIRDLQR